MPWVGSMAMIWFASLLRVFIERNRVDGSKGMAVRVINTAGTNSGFDQIGLRFLGVVVANNTKCGCTIGSGASIVETRNTSGAAGFSPSARNRVSFNIIYTPTTSGTFHGIDVYGTTFDGSAGNSAGPGSGSGTIPNGDCNGLAETFSAYSMISLRSTTLTPGCVDSVNEDYRLGILNLVDWCDASYNELSSAPSANGGPRPYDDPGILAEFGNFDLGGLERHPVDLIFRNGFD